MVTFYSKTFNNLKNSMVFISVFDPLSMFIYSKALRYPINFVAVLVPIGAIIFYLVNYRYLVRKGIYKNTKRFLRYLVFLVISLIASILILYIS